MQLSLAEPTIRDAISALGMLHERTTRKRLLEPSQNSLHLPMKLYNRAIRAIIDKVSGVSHDIQLVAMVNILFICFEYFQGNLHAAASHITGGINLLNNWRVMHQQEARRPWGQQYTSVEANFMERQVAPLLSLFNINAFQWGVDISNLFLFPRCITRKPVVSVHFILRESICWNYYPSRTSCERERNQVAGPGFTVHSTNIVQLPLETFLKCDSFHYLLAILLFQYPYGVFRAI